MSANLSARLEEMFQTESVGLLSLRVAVDVVLSKDMNLADHTQESTFQPCTLDIFFADVE